MGRIFISLVVVFVVVAGVLVYQATKGTSSLVLLPSELLGQAAAESSLARIRVAGKVVEPVSYQTQPELVLSFSVEDPKNPKGVVPVTYKGLKPDMFAAGRDVIIDGDYQNGRIEAATLQTQCPSKYEPAAPGTQYGPGTEYGGAEGTQNAPIQAKPS